MPSMAPGSNPAAFSLPCSSRISSGVNGAGRGSGVDGICDADGGGDSGVALTGSFAAGGGAAGKGVVTAGAGAAARGGSGGGDATVRGAAGGAGTDDGTVTSRLPAAEMSAFACSIWFDGKGVDAWNGLFRKTSTATLTITSSRTPPPMMATGCEASREDKERLADSSRSSSRSTPVGGAAEASLARRLSLRAASCAAKAANSLLPSTGGLCGGDFTSRNSVGRGGKSTVIRRPKECERSQGVIVQGTKKV